MEKGISESRFYMWRAILAFSLVDNVFSLEKQRLLQPYLRATPFSPRQRSILKKSFKNPESVEVLYKKITQPEDKIHFCVLTRALSLCGAYLDREESLHHHPAMHYQQYARAETVYPLHAAPSVHISV